MKKKNLCIIQARMNSTRLPGKVLLKVKGIPLLQHEIFRLQLSKEIDKMVIATTTNKDDDKVAALCKKINIDCFRGSEEDVLDRYFQCSKKYPEYSDIIRITGDCPLIDSAIVDQLILLYEEGSYDYASNVEPPTYPDGMDVEIFKKSVLIDAAGKAKRLSEREHVTLYIRKSKKNKKANLVAKKDFSDFRLTVDNLEDFEVIKFLIKNSKITDSYLKYISLLKINPGVRHKNIHIERNEGLAKSLKGDHVIARSR